MMGAFAPRVSEMAKNPIGLIGTGLLGTAIAERLLGTGFDVKGFDVSRSRLEAFSSLGGIALRSEAEVASHCDRLLFCLPDSTVTAEVLRAIDSSLIPDTSIMDATTGSPEHAVTFGNSLKERACNYLDTAVGGSSDLVRRGEAIVIAGGAPAALERCIPVLGKFARRVFHTGPCGTGTSMKLVLNLVLGLNRAALAEGLSLASGFGLSPEQALEVLKSGPAYSAAMDHKGQKMLSGDFTPQARLSQHLKDVRLMLDFGLRNGVRLPLSKEHASLLERAESMGLGDSDNSAVIKAFD